MARACALATALLAICLGRIASAVEPTGTPPVKAASQPTPPPRPLSFDRNGALILIRTSIIALQQANQTGNYSVLYALSAPGFQKVNSPERLSQIFAKLRSQNFDLSGILVLEPQLTILPELYANGTMRMAGFFPSVPMQVYFDLQFTPVQGQWRLIAISVDIGGATPAAPTPNPALASSYTPTPAPAPTPTPPAAPSPTPTPTVAASPIVEVRPAHKPTPTPKKNSRPGLGRSSPIDH